MAHFAKLDENNIVIFVTVGRQEDDGKEAELCARTGDVYKQTSYNTRGGVHYNPETGEPSADQSKALRKNYAGLGYTYDAGRDAFIPPKPYASWLLNEDTCLWDAPVPMPEDGSRYMWDEDTNSWVKIDAA
jgi:hypothetical protein